MTDVRVCGFCGEISQLGTRGRCQACGLYSDFKILPQDEAEGIARRRWRRFLRHRLVRLAASLVLMGSVVLWVMGAYFDTGFNPPPATTHRHVISPPHSWGQVRGTPQNTGYTPSPVPIPHRVKWMFSTSHPLYASPAVVSPHVYLATMDNRVLALDEQTGTPVWTYPLPGPSSSTPIVVNDTVIVAVRTGLVVALHRQTQAKQWETTLEGSILASPIVANGTLYLGTADRKLYALDVATGEQRWVINTEAWVVAPVAHAADRIIVTLQNSRLFGIGAETGRQRFLYDTGSGRHIMSTVAIQGDRAYFGDLRGRVWAVAYQETTYPFERGLLYWQTNFFIWGMIDTPPVQKGSLWSRRIRGSITHAPALAHNTVYVVSESKVIALDTISGQQQWATPLKETITTAPTVAHTTVLVGTETGLVGLHTQSGEHLWDFKTGQKMNANLVVANQTVYAVSHQGALYAITGIQP